MKKALSIALLVIYLVSVPAILGMADAKTTKKVVKKPVVVKKALVKKTAKKVLGVKTKVTYAYNPVTNTIVNCNMPDGKTIKVLKKDCEAVTAFWAQVRHSNPSAGNSGGSNNSGSNNSGSSNSSNNSVPTPTPTIVIPTPIISSVQVWPCTSSSCGFISTLKVIGTGFTANTRVKLTGFPEGTLVGGNGSTEIITDFFNVPAGTYTVTVYSINGDTTTVVAPTTVLIP